MKTPPDHPLPPLSPPGPADVARGRPSPVGSRDPSPRRLRGRAWAGAVLWVVASLLAARAVAPLLTTMWDLAMPPAQGQLGVYNATPGGGYYGMPVEIGDLDGDGHPDLVLAPMGVYGANQSRAESGEVYVYRGDGAIAGTIDRVQVGATWPGLTIVGARAGDYLGTELFTRDLNGDGIRDLLLSAQNYDGPAGDRDSCGAAFLIFGRPGLLDEPRTIDLLEPPADVVTILGARPGDRLGIWVEAGDLDGDGLGDILVGADQSPAGDPFATRFRNGYVAVIYGRQGPFPALFDLATEARTTPAAGNSDAPTESGVSILLGRDKSDHFGSTLHARDLDGDGQDELIASSALQRLSATRNPGGAPEFPAQGVGGGDGPDGTRTNCGEVQVFFSLPQGRRYPEVLDLGQELPALIASHHATVHGSQIGGSLGEELVTGDFDGNGRMDLVAGALVASNAEGAAAAGQAVVIYDAGSLAGKTLDLLPGVAGGIPEGLTISVLEGVRPSDLVGDTLSAGDVNHDGMDDLIVGVPMHDPPERTDAGAVIVVYGSSTRWPARWMPQVEVPDGLKLAFILGVAHDDLLSYSMEALDYDGDGYVDVFPNAMRGDGADDTRFDAGEAYLVSGYRLSGEELRVDAVTPGRGRRDREHAVEIAGEGFTTTADMAVTFGGLPGQGLEVVTGRQLRVTTPLGLALGPVDVAVTTRYGAVTLTGGFEALPAVPVFLRGDANASGDLDISDAIGGLGFLFLGWAVSCVDAVDTDDDGEATITDPIFLLQFLFLGGPVPPPPYPDVGPDPTEDALGCEAG